MPAASVPPRSTGDGRIALPYRWVGELISLECRVARVYSTTKLEGDLEIPSKMTSGQTFKEEDKLIRMDSIHVSVRFS